MLAFVLGGGASRGALQAGALEVIVDAGIVPEMVVGSSVGAVNGVYLANNPTVEGVRYLQHVYETIEPGDIFAGNDVNAVWHLLQGDRNLYDRDQWERLLERHLPANRFRDLQIPCYVLATEIGNGKAHVFGQDADTLLLDALLSSTAIIPLHPPWQYNGRFYVDGGLKSNLPIQEAIDQGATKVIAFNLTNQLLPADQRSTALDMLQHAVDLLLLGQVAATIDYARQVHQVDLIVLDLTYHEYVTSTDVSRIPQLIAHGRELAERVLSEGKLDFARDN